MVDVKFDGRFGNNLFQYTYARLFAIKNNLALISNLPPNDIISTAEYIGGEFHTTPIINIKEDYNDINWSFINDSNIKGCYYFEGFFQRYSFYENDLELIKTFFNYEHVDVDNYDDVVIHLRLTDYKIVNGGYVTLPQEYYFNLLEKLKFKKLYIVTDDPNDSYITPFINKYDCEIISQSAKHDFYFMMRFNTIIAANSTFSWWAAFLSKAKNKYLPKDSRFLNVIDLWKIGEGF